MYLKIKSVAQLKKEILRKKGEPVDFFILLAGMARSSKRISYNKKSKTFQIENEIDDTRQKIKEHLLESKTNIVWAIKGGAFYRY